MTSSPVLDPDAVDAFWAGILAAPADLVDQLVAATQAGQPLAAFEEVADQLAAVHPDLLLILGPAHPDRRPEVVISAGGIRAAFPAAHAVVDAAPPEVRDRFLLRALRPRDPHPQRLVLRYRDRTLSPADIRWCATPQRRDRTCVDLTLFVPGWIDALPADSGVNEPLAQTVFLLVDHVLGEYTTESQIGKMVFRSLPHAGDAPDLLALADHLDRLAAV